MILIRPPAKRRPAECGDNLAVGLVCAAALLLVMQSSALARWSAEPIGSAAAGLIEGARELGGEPLAYAAELPFLLGRR